MLLIEFRAAIDSVGRDDKTALMAARRRGDAEFLDLLLRNGASVKCSTRDGVSPLMIASEQGHSGIARLLLQSRADTWSWNAVGMTALILMLACLGGHAEVIRQLPNARVDVDAWDNGGSGGTTSLMFAANRGRLSGKADCPGVYGNDRLGSNLATRSVQVCCLVALPGSMTGTITT